MKTYCKKSTKEQQTEQQTNEHIKYNNYTQTKLKQSASPPPYPGTNGELDLFLYFKDSHSPSKIVMFPVMVLFPSPLLMTNQ